MKKIILVFVVALLSSVSCKNNSKLNPANQEAYCIYNVVNGTQKYFISCEKSKTDMQQKMIQLRNDGVVNATSVKKSTCSDC